ncbi:hypothetical protein HaLaN_30320 [Haematococcus lacustris]|uniref:Uncharacterized protein n=1 Tax=Haematococcus lacustris TaxID=44745 RepID=A0A6A0AGY5_HAELA|nr:hypothetical protein HaLaN_30320 [Haematococcus lacustris]
MRLMPSALSCGWDEAANHALIPSLFGAHAALAAARRDGPAVAGGVTEKTVNAATGWAEVPVRAYIEQRVVLEVARQVISALRSQALRSLRSQAIEGVRPRHGEHHRAATTTTTKSHASPRTAQMQTLDG